MKKEKINFRYNLYFFGDSNYLFSRIFFKSLISINAKNTELKASYDNCLKNTDSFYFNLKKKIKIILYYLFNREYLVLFNYLCKNEIKYKNIKNICIKENIKIIKNINFELNKKNNEVNILLNVGNPIILDEKIVSNFDIALNYHSAELPRFRGIHSNSLSILKNNIFTGFCFHLIDKKIDNGDVVYNKKIRIKRNILYSQFYEIVKIKIMSRKIEEVIKKKELYSLVDKNINKQRSRYYSKKFFQNLSNKSYLLSIEYLQKLMLIFGGIEFDGQLVTKIKKSKDGEIKTKDGYAKIVHINFLPVLFKKLFSMFNMLTKFLKK